MEEAIKYIPDMKEEFKKLYTSFEHKQECISFKPSREPSENLQKELTDFEKKLQKELFSQESEKIDNAYGSKKTSGKSRAS